MKELTTRAISGALYVSLLIISLLAKELLFAVLLVFGLVCIAEFNNLIKLRSRLSYIIFSIIYLGFGYLMLFSPFSEEGADAIQIYLVTTIFVNLILLKDLLSESKIPLFDSKQFILVTFYLTSGFVFLLMIANYQNQFTPFLLLGSFIMVWVNDSFAYLVGKNFGKQKLFPRISPKKTVEGFLGGLFFSCIASYFMARFTHTLEFSNWLILSIIISVIGTLGDLIESKFKRQANVKDSGVIMPGHGGLLDRLDSIIFAAPFIYLLLRVINYVS